MTAAASVGVLDRLVARIREAYPYTYTVASTPDEHAIAYRMRYDAIIAEGWAQPDAFPEGLEHDEHDETAVHVIGWDEGEPVSTGRVIFPPFPLPTEQICAMVVQPSGQVVDIGRMTVRRSYQTYRHAAFIGLLCQLYSVMRDGGMEVACGMMSPRVRRLMRQLGLSLDLIGDDRPYWGEDRAPVRFALTTNALTLPGRWSRSEDE